MSPLDRARRPEYTGDNRCWPCTVLNVGLVSVATLAIAVVSGPLALVVLTGGLTAVVLRGYVVPGTPRFGPRVAAVLPVSFGHGDPAPDGGGRRQSDPLTAGTDEQVDGERVAAALVDAGVVVPDEGAIRLSDAFATDWAAEMAALRELSPDELAAAVGRTAPFDGDARALEDGLVLEGPGGSVYLSTVRAIADAGAVRALARDEYDVPDTMWVHATDPLRTLVPECPTTGGAVVESTVGNCCGGPGGTYGSPDQRVLICEETEEVLFAFDPLEGEQAAE
jgi:hypothetical protein